MKQIIFLFTIMSLTASASPNLEEMSLQDFKNVSELSTDKAEEYLPALNKLSGDEKRALIISLGNAKVEAVRSYLIKTIDEGKDDYDVLCALWSLEKLDKKTDEKTLQALWNTIVRNEFRSADYANALFAIADKQQVAKFLKQKLNGDENQIKLAFSLISANHNNDMLSDIVEFIKSNKKYKNLALQTFAGIINQNQLEQYLQILDDSKLPAAQVTQIINMTKRLDKRSEVIDFLNKLEGKSAEYNRKAIIGRLGIKYPLYVMDTTMLNLGKKETQSLDKIKLTAKLGYSGAIFGMTRIVAITPMQQAPDKTETNVQTVNTLYSDMRKLNFPLKYVLDFTKLSDGEFQFTLPIDNVLRFAYPMGASLMITVKGKPKNFSNLKPEMLDNLAEKCKAVNVKLVIYPHQGSIFPDVKTALSFIEQCKSDNIYTIFNIPHEYAQLFKDKEKLNPKSAAEYVLANKDKIIAVSICGIDEGHEKASNAINVLGSGSIDIKAFTDILFENKYQGDIMIQGSNLWSKMSMEEALETTMNTWKTWYK